MNGYPLDIEVVLITHNWQGNLANMYWDLDKQGSRLIICELVSPYPDEIE